jgi:patatin-related protein
MSPDGAADPARGDLQETRIAVAFFGGVALAVYESGVAYELYRLVKGEGAYGGLPGEVGPVSVDVLAGTSAGGLNAALLANALVNGGDLRKLMTLWRDEGDLDKLLYGPFKANPASLLDGDRFRRKILEALLAKRPASPEEPALQPTLDLCLTATNLDGDRVVVRTADGDAIATRTHRQVFRFRYQAAGPEGTPPPANDFRGEEDLALLAEAARASASFPFAFEPVRVTREGLGRRSETLEAAADHIDGGVLDNKPVALALQAVAARRSDRRVDRLLFYVEPNPEAVEPRTGGGDPPARTAPEVALAALVGLPGYQSLTAALQDVERHNRSVAERRRPLDYFNAAAAAFRAGLARDASAPPPAAAPPPSSVDEALALLRTETLEDKPRRYYVPVDGATAFYRALEDGYLDLRVERDLSPAMLGPLKAIRERARALADSAGAAPGVARPPDEILYRLKGGLLDALDLQYPRRMYRYLVQIVRDLYPGPEARAAAPEAFAGVTRALNRMKRFLYGLEDHVGRLRQPAEVEAAERARVEALLQEAVEALRARQLGARGDPAGDLEALLRRALDSPLLEGRRQALRSLQESVWLRLRNDMLELLETVRAASGAGAPALPAADLVAGCWKLRDALSSFYLRDLVLYPAVADGESDLELKPIRVARISPDDADPFGLGLGAREKLAGETCFHFGGFLREAWRGNDLTWGRLDAAEILLRRLLPRPDQEARRKDLTRRAHREILRDMRSLGMGIREPAAAGGREEWIGRQDLGAVPVTKKIEWGLRGALTTLKVLRRSAAESRAAWLLRGPLTALDWALHPLVWIAVLATAVLRVAARSRAVRVALAAAALMLLGVLLWEFFLRDAAGLLADWLRSHLGGARAGSP